MKCASAWLIRSRIDPDAVITFIGDRGIAVDGRLIHAAVVNTRAGNGALMRTAALALAYVNDPWGLVAAAKAVSDLIHRDPASGEACALWSLGIRHAVLHGTFDGYGRGWPTCRRTRSDFWRRMLGEAEANPPSAFANNDWVVQAKSATAGVLSATAIPAHTATRGEPRWTLSNQELASSSFLRSS